MKSSSGYRIAMIGAMLIVLLNTWVAVRALQSLFVSQGWRAHTLEVITHTRALELEVKTADSATRGYLLTAQPIYEQRYRTAAEGVFSELDTLKSLTGDNTSQQERLAFLRARIQAKVASLNAGIAIRQGTEGLINPGELTTVLTDSPDGPSVSYCIQQIEAEEERLLGDRNRETTKAQSQVWWSFGGATILDILLIAAAAELLIRTLRDRQTLAARAAQIALLNADLTALNTDLEERVAQRTRELATSNQELEAFSYSVSHDLRAPLRTIDGFSLALEEDFAEKLDESGRDYIRRVRSGVQRMGTLIDALLQLSRVTRAELTTDRTDLSQLATLVFNELLAADPERDITLVAQPGVLAVADARLVRIALENLIGNAFKFTSKTPAARIEFGTTQRDGKPVYFVRDNGAGFDMQYVDRLFTAFQRLHGDRDFKGSGIGLATVSRIIRRHHGNIWAESVVGQGATFFFTLAA